jgi:uncharacterized protein
VQPRAFFLSVEAPETGQRMCLHYPAQGDTHCGQIVFVHPFAEEMNKSRRMVALQARVMAQAGFSVMQIDLLGCGDSSGDFGDATWQSWVNDVVQACRWLRRQNPPQEERAPAPLWLWGLRAGCLIAVDAASQLEEPCHFLFWQPPSSGKPLLQQFLRLRVAGDMLNGESKGAMETLRRHLANNESIEIAGYMLSPELASGLEHATLRPVSRSARGQRLEWLELSTRTDFEFGSASKMTINQWQQSGIQMGSRIVQGPAFWQASETEDAPALITATMVALNSLAS